LVFIVHLLVNDVSLGSNERMESPRRSPGCIDVSNPFVDDRYRHERKKIVIFCGRGKLRRCERLTASLSAVTLQI
jgi:hypothetical protein